MTDSEWAKSTDPAAMLAWLRPNQGQPELDVELPNRISDRKSRLFACTCARMAFDLKPGSMDLEAVEAGELWADMGVRPKANLGFHTGAGWCAQLEAAEAAKQWARPEVTRPTAAERAALLRDIVNPFSPLRIRWQDSQPARYLRTEEKPGSRQRQGGETTWIEYDVWERIDWITPTAQQLVRTIYEDRDWGLMPMLADKLEEDGCEDKSLLQHCRGQELIPQPATGKPPLAWYGPLRGPHCRGCWAVDLLTRRE